MLTLSVQLGYKATLPLVLRVPLCMGGSNLCQGGRCQFVPPPDTEGYLPIAPPMFGLANHDPVP